MYIYIYKYRWCKGPAAGHHSRNHQVSVGCFTAPTSRSDPSISRAVLFGMEGLTALLGRIPST